MEEDQYGGLKPAEKQLSAGGLDWQYLEWEFGEPHTDLILLHGITSSAWSWWQVAPVLAGKGFRVVAPFMPGHGGTSPLPTGYKIEGTAKAVAAFGQALGLGPDALTLAGHSWGGATALLIAARQLLPLSKVVLVDPVLQFSDQGAEAPMYKDFERTVSQPTPSTHEQLQASSPTWGYWDIEWKRRFLSSIKIEAVRGVFVDNSGQNLLEYLGQVPAPLLLMVGEPELGSIISSKMREKAQSLLKPGDKLAIVSEAGHNPHRENYKNFMGAFDEFLGD
jgi:pimeloyl-ACP methyl ester carboxylesterase